MKMSPFYPRASFLNSKSRNLSKDHFKCGVVFGESRIQHARQVKHLSWKLGSVMVDERKVNKNLAVNKNFESSYMTDLTKLQ